MEVEFGFWDEDLEIGFSFRGFSGRRAVFVLF